MFGGTHLFEGLAVGPHGPQPLDPVGVFGATGRPLGAGRKVSAGATDLDAIFTLNEVGALIWERVDGTATVAEIAAAVAAEFQVSEPEALADTRDFLTALAAEGLVCPA